MVNLDARQKRETGFGISLPFTRALTVPDGSNADSAGQRASLAMNYFGAMTDLYSRQRRECGFGVCLPFTRPGPVPDGSNADGEGERAHIVMNYCGIATSAIVDVLIAQARSIARFVFSRIHGRVN